MYESIWQGVHGVKMVYGGCRLGPGMFQDLDSLHQESREGYGKGGGEGRRTRQLKHIFFFGLFLSLVGAMTEGVALFFSLPFFASPLYT